MKTDARIRYTKMVIKNSFIALLKDYPVNRITVTDVCNLAEINRATFYKHYTDCFDLLDKIELDMIKELQQLLQGSKNKNLTDLFINIFDEIKKDSSLYLVVTSNHGNPSFPNRILNMFYDEMISLFDQKTPSISINKKEWLYFFSANGCAGLLSHWITSGMKEDTKELAEYIKQLLEKIAV